MATEFQKSVVRAVEASTSVFPDRVVVRRDGSVMLRRYYFYTFGASAESFRNAVCAVLSAAGVRAQATASDDWAAWPKKSYFTVVVRECSGEGG